MAHQVLSSALVGIDAQAVRVQIDSSRGIHDFTIVGLGDKAIQESVDRIESALKHCGFEPPRSKNRRFIVNLAPADLRKEGPGYDLPIAVAYLLESGQLRLSPEHGSVFLLGELGLDGKLAHTNGILAATFCARDAGIAEIIVPHENASEAAVVEGVQVIGVRDLRETTDHLTGVRLIAPTVRAPRSIEENTDDALMHIRGQETAKRALIIAAAGGHNVLMSGTPGSGKTLLARALRGMLPRMTIAESLEVGKIYSAAGLLKSSVLDLARPFCSPHHTASAVSIVGGGTNIRPGQISLAHRGVLLLDEMPEFARNLLEALRQPLEDGVITITRASGSMTLPAKFILVGAMNPCPCGNIGNPSAICTCTSMAITRYVKRISGPLLDRFDITVHVPQEDIKANGAVMSTETMKKVHHMIARARERQAARFVGRGIITNSEVDHRAIEHLCVLTPSARMLLERVVNKKHLSLRAYHKIQKVARTIADLDDADTVTEHHIAEAIALRISELPSFS